ncbi:hypothetical protein [Pontibacter roseus]|uniref:hypothetical protein n=1 Tax=Pontibacter roseus TaxID=336989 RepID=UPI00036360F3|nr:hypothetical protein [Pontibacter roseus]
MKRPYKYYRNSLGRRYCTLRYLEMNNTLSIIWKGTAPAESIQKVEAGLMEMLQRYGCSAIISDEQEFFEAPTEVLADLTRSSWYKEVASKAGVRYIAHVLPPEEELPEPVEGNDSSPEIRFFSHKMDALEWLSHQVDT